MRAERKASPFCRGNSTTRGSHRLVGSVVHFRKEHWPVFAQHIPARPRSEVQAIAIKGIASGAIAVGPVSVRQALCHRRRYEPMPVCPIATVVVPRYKDALHRILYRMEERGPDLGIKARILVQRRRQHKGSEKLGRRLASHG